ncbi:DNA cytosine methyltransferase [Bergeyella zoohelcum]|uniref:Cytosine-specific methyltransferase n=1 Tax=Bergeyella zoohelcum TaxID=1015 RepID=A0A376C1M1_9FLAO|nr:DNA (cytosine-5-)-methyltransferase [Bergeyella zoohelcum]EKB60759.1 DNA (cytosine-5-)-methyltransferase [Bergeyella zoohelcum CCUG 30536]SSZ47150.1 Modification methylase BanI [Bergeyella zoohelcum]
MEKRVNVLDLFSGIGGFSLGLERAGFEINKHYFSEINKHSVACYRYRFPNAMDLGDVQQINSETINERIDIITFGSPCQDFSLAGKRQGLEGERSSLIKEAMRLIKELQPSVFIWENVKGTFSSNAGRDFKAILQAFANIGGYRLEWQLLNTRWFLPQNRERIYLVGHFAGRSKPGIFPIGENDFLFGNPKKTNERQSQTQYSTTLKASGVMKADDTFIEVPKIAGCLTGGGNSGGLHSDMTTIKVGTFRTHNDGKGFREVKSEVCPTIPARARQDGSGQPVIQQLPRGKNQGNNFEICPTISSNAFEQNNFVSGIRRLTEIECERLQGFPDDWTKYGNYYGTIKEISKTQRYKMLGNAVTVDVVCEVAKRLLRVNNLL